MPSPTKRQVLERLLGQGMVMVHLDARRPGVRVPVSLRTDDQLRLNLSYRFSSRDLDVGDEMVSCTLSFSGQPYHCKLPLDAIFAATSHVTGEALVWPESVAGALESPATAHGALAVVAPTDGQASRPASAASLPERRHLRLVK